MEQQILGFAFFVLSATVIFLRASIYGPGGEPTKIVANVITFEM